jgi:hypothetical protein
LHGRTARNHVSRLARNSDNELVNDTES